MENVKLLLPEHDILVRHGCKQSKHGRASGGVTVFIKRSIFRSVTPVQQEFKHGVSFILNQEYLGSEVVFIFTYLPPFGSCAYSNEEQNGVVLLEEYVNMLEVNYPDSAYIISGDFNARTKDSPDFIIDDAIDYLPLPDMYPIDDFDTPRKSRDMHGDINVHGTTLLDFCCTHNMHMLNGRVAGDMEGNLTCFTANGSSVVDYTIVSSQLFRYVNRFEIAPKDCYTHLPQTLCLKLQNAITKENDMSFSHSEYQGNARIFYGWTPESLQAMLNSNYITEIEQNLYIGQIDEAVRNFNGLIKDSCSARKSSRKKSTEKHQNEWWDSEMDHLKYVKYKALRHLRSNPSKQTLDRYRVTRKHFKSKMKEKKEQIKDKMRRAIENVNSASDFWKYVKSITNNKSCYNTNISKEEWKIYFESLLNCKNPIEHDFEQDVIDYMSWHDSNCNNCVTQADSESDLNKEISIVEIDVALDELHKSKSPGLDGVTNEILKNASIVVAPLLCKLFNAVLDSGFFPEQWSQALIIPIHKKGDKNDMNNYRGISLLSCTGKVFTKILNNRITKWAEDNNKIDEAQAGFRKGKSTIDQIFIFQSLVSKYVAKPKGRFYSVFIDFSKAFDCVPHLHLFYSLVNEGLHGKIICVLRDMYNKLKSCVLSNGGNVTSVSELFHCTNGTRQGCIISPLMFILYLNELSKQLVRNDCKGIYIDENHQNTNLLLFADDLVLFGDNVGRLQDLLNNLSVFCKRWGLSVNMSKTNFMVFRNGGIIKKNEKVYFDGRLIDNCTYYKYLGVVMSTRLSWSPAQKTLSQQAGKAMNVIKKLNYNCNFSFVCGNELFDKCVLPVLTYGAEVWGTSVHSSIEQVLCKFCRHQLGVGSKAPTPAVLGECGRNSLYVQCYLKCVKYWLKLISSEEGTLLRSCYEMLVVYCNAGRSNWATGIKNMLYSLGYGYVWEKQSVENPAIFIREFGMRLLDCDLQKWSQDLSNMPKLRTSELFKLILEPDPYLLLYIPRKIRSVS